MPFFPPPPPSLKAMNTILINILNTYLGILPKNNGRLPRKLFYFKGLFLSCGSIYRFWYEPLSALSVHFYTLFKNFIDLTSAAEGSGVYYRKRLDTSTEWWPISFVSLWYLKKHYEIRFIPTQIWSVLHKHKLLCEIYMNKFINRLCLFLEK